MNYPTRGCQYPQHHFASKDHSFPTIFKIELQSHNNLSGKHALLATPQLLTLLSNIF